MAHEFEFFVLFQGKRDCCFILLWRDDKSGQHPSRYFQLLQLPW